MTTPPPSTQAFPPGTGLEHRPGATGEVRTLSVPDPDGHPFTFSYQVVDGLAVYQGDMILGTAADVAAWESADEVDAQSTALHAHVCWKFLGFTTDCDHYRWPDAVVPYTFENNWDDPATNLDESAMMRVRIRAAMDEIEAVAAVRFVPRASQGDYVRFSASKGCSANLGRIGGQQQVHLSTNCGEWAVVHELLHALGIQHEHARRDRDSYVTIVWANVRDGMGYAFNGSDLAFDIGSYDYDSIMHYGPTAFCKVDANKQCVGPTIETIPPGVPIGQRSSLSAGDLAAINLLYPGEPPTVAITMPSAGASLQRGQPMFLAAAVDDPEDMDVTVTWSSDVDGVLGTGASVAVLTTGFPYGSRVITARAVDPQGNVATDTVTVSLDNSPPTATVLQPLPGAYCVGEPLTFVADVTDPNQTIPDAAVSWRVGSAAPFATGRTATRTFGWSGDVQVIVRATDERNAYGEDVLSLVIASCTDQPPAVTITKPSGDATFAYDGKDDGLGLWYTDVELVGSAVDPEDGTLGGGSMVWTTDRSSIQPPVLGTGSSLTVRLYSNVCEGVTHTITLTATDSDGNVRTAVRRITIWTLC